MEQQMSNEPNLHSLFRDALPPNQLPIDVASVIRRSRARRLPKQIGAGGVFTLAIGAVGFGGIQGIIGLQGSTASSDSAGGPMANPLVESPGTPGSVSGGGIRPAPAERINLCGEALTAVAPSESGLTLTTSFPDAAVGSSTVEGMVTMTNSSANVVIGHTDAAPTLTLSQNNVVLWHSNGPTIMMAREVSLAPGESIEYATSFTPVVCSVEDDEGQSFRGNLPPAPAGQYQVSAAIDFNADGRADLVTGPPSTITLH
jgi:hypothetical protein